jgi:hypothetical protein
MIFGVFCGGSECSACFEAPTMVFLLVWGFRRIWLCYGSCFSLFAAVVVVGCWVIEVYVAPATVFVGVRCSGDGCGDVLLPRRQFLWW